MPFLAEACITLTKDGEWVADYAHALPVRVYGFTQGMAVCRLPDSRFRLIPVELISTKE